MYIDHKQIPVGFTDDPWSSKTDCFLQVMSIWSSTLLNLVTARINEASSNNQESDTGQGYHAEQRLQVQSDHKKSCCIHCCLALLFTAAFGCLRLQQLLAKL